MTQDYSHVVHEIAEAIAPGWERRRPFIETTVAPVREWLIRELAPRPGATVLELAAGAGDTGFDAAARIGGHGRLISTDISPAMLEVCRRRGAERGVINAEYRVTNAERIDLGDDSVDGVLCRFGYMLMADPAAALAETRRVLRPGGRLALAVWGPPDRNPYFTLIAMALVARGHLSPPDPAAPGLFSLDDHARLRALLGRAGFTSARTEEVPVRFAFADAAEYLDVTADTAGPFAMILRGLPEAELAAIRAQLQAGIAPFAVGRGYQIPGLAIAAAAS